MDEGEREKDGEDLEGQEGPGERAEDPDPGFFDRLEEESAPLHEGEAIDTRLGPLPVRSMAAMAAMLLVAVVVYLVAWGLFGGVGLLLGWLPAAALGLLAAREVGRRASS